MASQAQFYAKCHLKHFLVPRHGFNVKNYIAYFITKTYKLIKVDFYFGVEKFRRKITEAGGSVCRSGGAALWRCGETWTTQRHQEIPRLNWKLVPRNSGVGKLISYDSEISLLDK